MEHITCDCPVLGTWQSGLIVFHDGRPRAVGKSQVHRNLYPTSTKRLEGKSLMVVGHKGGPARPHTLAPSSASTRGTPTSGA